MRKIALLDGSDAECCPECGVPLKAGVKYCEFCGLKVAEEIPVVAPVERRPYGAAVGMLKGFVVACLAIGVLVFVGNRLGETPSAPAPKSLDAKRQASAACEASIREKSSGPFRVIAFRSALVAEERGGYVVSGTVEMQSAAGELQRKRYFCRVHPDAKGGVVFGEGRIY